MTGKLSSQADSLQMPVDQSPQSDGEIPLWNRFFKMGLLLFVAGSFALLIGLTATWISGESQAVAQDIAIKSGQDVSKPTMVFWGPIVGGGVLICYSIALMIRSRIQPPQEQQTTK
jgi:hypothetical protein